MRAFVLDGYGAIADHVRLAEIADPVPGPGDVLNRNPCRQPQSDRLQDRAWRPEARLEIPAAAPVRVRCQRCRDRRWAPRASKFKPGDAVFVRASRDTIGTFAEQDRAWRKSRRAQAGRNFARGSASLPLVGLTTLQMFGRAGAKSGQRILIHAGSGGVGTFAVQYAKHLGLHVTVDHEFEERRFRQLRSGADRVIAYDRENYLRAGWRLRHRLRHARRRIHRRCLQGGEARRRRDLAQRAAGSRFRPARRRGLLVRIVVWLMGRKVYAASAAPARDLLTGPSRSPTATNCARSPPSSMAARSSR